MSYQQLKEIIDGNVRNAIEEKTRPITKCPNCDYPELRENKNRDLLCPICGWTSRR